MTTETQAPAPALVPYRLTVRHYSDPAGRGPTAGYRTCAIYGKDAAFPIVLDGREVGRIAVKDLLS